MSGKLLIDTNAVSAVLEENSVVVAILVASDQIYVPSIVLGELYYMAENSGRKQANYERVARFMKGRIIVNCDAITAALYAKVRHSLKVKGRPVSENDLWIAALAVQYNLPVLTRDSDFQAVDGLTVVSW